MFMLLLALDLQNLDNRGVLQKTPLGEGAGMIRSSELIPKVLILAENADAPSSQSQTCGLQPRKQELRPPSVHASLTKPT